MDAIKSWVMTVCFAAVAAGMAGILAPSGNLEKIYKFVISLFFLCCVLVPVFSLKNIRISDFIPAQAASTAQSSENMQDTVKKQEVDQARQKIADLIGGVCKTCGITPVSVSVSVTMDKNGQMQAVSCGAVLRSQDGQKKEQLAAAVKSQLGLDLQITTEEAKK